MWVCAGGGFGMWVCLVWWMWVCADLSACVYLFIFLSWRWWMWVCAGGGCRSCCGSGGCAVVVDDEDENYRK